MKGERTITNDLATYMEWLELIREARDISLSIEEIRDFIALSTDSFQPAENKTLCSKELKDIDISD